MYGVKQLTRKEVWEVYNLLLKNFKNEYEILLEVPLEKLEKVVDARLARIILLNRENKLEIKPGYDGVYGEIVLSEKEKINKQKKLDMF